MLALFFGIDRFLLMNTMVSFEVDCLRSMHQGREEFADRSK